MTPSARDTFQRGVRTLLETEMDIPLSIMTWTLPFLCCMVIFSSLAQVICTPSVSDDPIKDIIAF
jgi:hypothetical protein